jgi:hypothetical protein
MDKLQGQIAEVSQEFGIGSESRSFVFGQPDQPVKGHDQVMGSDSSAQLRFVCLAACLLRASRRDVTGPSQGFQLSKIGNPLVAHMGRDLLSL